MRKQIIGTMLSVVTFTAFMTGCGNGSSTPVQTEPAALTSGNIVANQTGTETVTLNSSQINAGVLTTDVALTTTTKDTKSTSTLTIPSGTSFTNESTEALTNVTPKLAATQKKGKETTSSETTNIVQTEIKLTDTNGNKIIPTEALTVKVKAPEGAKPGDEVQVSIPQDATIQAATQQKLAISIVGSDGFVYIFLSPNVFRNTIVVFIIIEFKVPNVVTGGEGGTN